MSTNQLPHDREKHDIILICCNLVSTRWQWTWKK